MSWEWPLGRLTLPWPGCLLVPLEEPAQGTGLLGDQGDMNLEVLNGCCWVSHLGHWEPVLGARHLAVQVEGTSLGRTISASVLSVSTKRAMLSCLQLG